MSGPPLPQSRTHELHCCGYLSSSANDQENVGQPTRRETKLTANNSIAQHVRVTRQRPAFLLLSTQYSVANSAVASEALIEPYLDGT
jgi:hypothetical protein